MGKNIELNHDNDWNIGGHMKKSNLISKQKYIRRRTVNGKKTESIMECIQITPAGGVFFCGGNLEKLTNKEIEEELNIYG